MKNKFIAILTTALLSMFVLSKQSINANEGLVQMEAQDGTSGRCIVFSNLMQDFNFNISINCRGLKYPISQNLFQYVLWADHGDSQPTRLGTLGIGKKTASIQKSFGRLFVTKEAGDQPKTPSGEIYMIGEVKALAYLEGVGVNPETISPTESPTQTEEPSLGAFGQASKPVTAASLTSQNNATIGNAIRILGGIVIVVVILVVVIAFISASRRRPVNI